MTAPAERSDALQAVLGAVAARFKSGNSVPVERAMVTAAEWAVLEPELRAPWPPIVIRPQDLAAAVAARGSRSIAAEVLLNTLIGAGLLALVLTAAAGLWPELLLLLSLSFFVGLAVSSVQALLRHWRWSEP